MCFFTCVVNNLHSMQVTQILTKLHKYLNILLSNRKQTGTLHYALLPENYVILQN
jgi:hypothetical protein